LASNTEKPDPPQNYDLPREPGEQILVFVENYNNKRVHESLNNLTSAEVYFGRGPAIPEEMERIKRLTQKNRRVQHQLKAT